MKRTPPELWSTLGFWRQKHEAFERLTHLEFRDYSLERREIRGGIEYTDPRTQKLWTYWLQAYEQGKHYLEIERPDGMEQR